MKRLGEILLSVGVLVVAVVFAVYSFNFLKIFEETGSYHVYAEFRDTSGLTVGAEVRIAGIEIGQVLDKRLDHNRFTSVVTMMIDDKVKIPKDSLISINSSGILSNSHIKITPGNDEYIADNMTFANTKSAASLEELIGRAIYVLSSSGHDSK